MGRDEPQRQDRDHDDNGREREKYPVVYGAKIKIKDGGRDVGQRLVEWDPYSLPF